MEAYIDEVRAANAAGIAWDESKGWLQMASESEPATPGLFAESVYGDFMTGVASKIGSGVDEKRRDRDRERERVGGRTSKTTSPTPTTSTIRKKEKKAKKTARVSGLSYY